MNSRALPLSDRLSVKSQRDDFGVLQMNADHDIFRAVQLDKSLACV